jgi:hypothetical protein
VAMITSKVVGSSAPVPAGSASPSRAGRRILNRVGNASLRQVLCYTLATEKEDHEVLHVRDRG